MAELDNIIQITITRETQAVATASFNIPLIMDDFTNFSERARIYTDIDEVGEDFATTTTVYKIAQLIFGQSLGRVPSLVVGRRQVNEVEGTVSTVTTGQVYSVTINGTTYAHTAVGGNTAAIVVAAIKAAYDLAPKAGITFTDNLDGTFTVEVDVAGTAWSIISTSNVLLENVAPVETLTAALAAIEAANNTWYALVASYRTQADQEELAAAIETRNKIYATSTANSGALAGTTTDLGAVLENSNFSRTMPIYHSLAATTYMEAAILGKVLPLTVGSYDFNFESLTGTDITPDNLTATQLSNLTSKNYSRYTEIAGVEVFREGLAADGRPLDEIVISDFLYARMQERIYSRLVNLRKIPMTQAGATIIENEIRGVLKEMEANGGLVVGSSSVTAPIVANIPFNDKVLGKMGTFVFRAIYQGAVRQVIINGTLTY